MVKNERSEVGAQRAAAKTHSIRQSKWHGRRRKCRLRLQLQQTSKPSIDGVDLQHQRSLLRHRRRKLFANLDEGEPEVRLCGVRSEIRVFHGSTQLLCGQSPRHDIGSARVDEFLPRPTLEQWHRTAVKCVAAIEDTVKDGFWQNENADVNAPRPRPEAAWRSWGLTRRGFNLVKRLITPKASAEDRRPDLVKVAPPSLARPETLVAAKAMGVFCLSSQAGKPSRCLSPTKPCQLVFLDSASFRPSFIFSSPFFGAVFARAWIELGFADPLQVAHPAFIYRR
mgnify:CR=1 FL=1